MRVRHPKHAESTYSSLHQSSRQTTNKRCHGSVLPHSDGSDLGPLCRALRCFPTTSTRLEHYRITLYFALTVRIYDTAERTSSMMPLDMKAGPFTTLISYGITFYQREANHMRKQYQRKGTLIARMVAVAAVVGLSPSVRVY